MITDRRIRTFVGALCIAGAAVALGPNALADDYNNPSQGRGTSGQSSGVSSGGASSGGQSSSGQSSSVQSGSDTARGGGPTATLSDAQIAAVTAAANTGEVQQGQLAVRRATRPEVRQFAQMMIDQHTQMSNDQRALLQRLHVTPAQSQLSTQITNDGRQHMARLRSLRGDAFDRAYVDIQVMEHQQVLSTLDTQLIPNASNPEMRQLLTTARGQIAQHLQHGQQLQATLSSQPQGQQGQQGQRGMQGGQGGGPGMSGSSGSQGMGTQHQHGMGSQQGGSGSSGNSGSSGGMGGSQQSGY